MSDIWAACGLSIEEFAISVGEMEDDPQFSRLCVRSYVRGGWLYFPFESTLVSITTLPGDRPDPYLAALGIDGEVFFVGASTTAERIPGAGLGDDDDEAGRGSMTEIRAFGDVLLACGNGSQVYRRDPSVPWVRLCDDSIGAVGDNSFRSISMNSDGWIAACGFSKAVYREPTEAEEAELERISDTGTMRDYLAARERYTALQQPPHGCLFVNDRLSWTSVALPGNAYLHSALTLPDGRFLAAGGGGLIVAGRDHDQFEDFSLGGFSETFHAARRSGAETYLLADNCIVVLGSDLREVRSIVLPDELRSPVSIEIFGDLIWYFDNQGVACHDGKNWRVIELPAATWEG